MTSEINPVLLQAQNIDLKQRLEAAEQRISELRSAVSQGAIHMTRETNNDKLSAELESLRKASSPAGNKNAGSSPSTAEISKLQQQVEDLKRSLESEQEKTQSLEVEVEWMREQQQIQQQEKLKSVGSNSGMNSFSPESSAPPPPPPSSAPPNESLLAMIEQEREKRENLEKDVGSLRSKLAASNAEAFKYKSSASKLEKEIEALKNQNNVAVTHDPAHVEMIKKLNEELNQQLASMKLKTEDSESELQRMKAAMEHLQQELRTTRTQLSTAISNNNNNNAKPTTSPADAELIATLRAENKKILGELDDEKLDNGSLVNEISTLRNAITKIEEERAREKQLAAEAEFDRMLEGSDAEGQLRKQLRECQEERDKAKAAAEKSQAEHLIMLRLKDKTLLQLNQTSEELIKAREHFQKREEDLLKQIQDGRTSPKTPIAPSTPPPPPIAATAVAQKNNDTPSNESFSSPCLTSAAKSQEALQKERDTAARDRRKQELLERLKAKTREDQSTAEEIFKRTAKAYDGLLKQLREAYREDSAKGQEEVYYDFLWDYERRAWHMNNDYQSMRTIVDIKQSDMNSEIQRLREADETKLAILRMQLQDLGKIPQC